MRARGKALYSENCVLCHGANADGRGVRSMGLDKPPANFTEPAWGQPEAVQRAWHAINDGVPGSAMPSWRTLSEEDRWALVAYLTSVSERGP